MELIQLENEIKLLLRFRLSKYDYDIAVVEAYTAMDKSIICRIELFREEWIVESRVAKYEAQVKEGFYFEAERKLIGQISKKETIIPIEAEIKTDKKQKSVCV